MNESDKIGQFIAEQLIWYLNSNPRPSSFRFVVYNCLFANPFVDKRATIKKILLGNLFPFNSFCIFILKQQIIIIIRRRRIGEITKVERGTACKFY